MADGLIKSTKRKRISFGTVEIIPITRRGRFQLSNSPDELSPLLQNDLTGAPTKRCRGSNPMSDSFMMPTSQGFATDDSTPRLKTIPARIQSQQDPARGICVEFETPPNEILLKDSQLLMHGMEDQDLFLATPVSPVLLGEGESETIQLSEEDSAEPPISHSLLSEDKGLLLCGVLGVDKFPELGAEGGAQARWSPQLSTKIVDESVGAMPLSPPSSLNAKAAEKTPCMPNNIDTDCISEMRRRQGDGSDTTQQVDKGERFCPQEVFSPEGTRQNGVGGTSSITAAVASSLASLAKKCVLCGKTILTQLNVSQTNGMNTFSMEQHGSAFHVVCALWCPEVYYDIECKEFKNIDAAVERAKNLECGHCRKGGATIGCVDAECLLSYHLHCALHLKLTMNIETFQLCCPAHGEVIEKCRAKGELFIA